MAQKTMQMAATGAADSTVISKTTETNPAVKLPRLRDTMQVDRSKPLPTSLQSDFVPDDILFALSQSPQPKEKLGPPAQVAGRPRPANLWSFKRKEKFQHLLNSTVCSCGAGRDTSFLYDVHPVYDHPEKTDKVDLSAVRKEAEDPPKNILKLPETLIPEEYHIVKSKGVMGLEYHEDKYSTNPEDHDKHLVVFPSMKPSSRYEVLQLRKTMDSMLEKVGFYDTDQEHQGPTQVHNLIELIKKEQDIFNIIFHEIIRQSSVECADRGKLLSDLRDKYSELLCRVPEQIMGMHEEVMAQRALDRRLTEELIRFKNTIAVLTSELSEVREHDKSVTTVAQKTQIDLRRALDEAQKNSSLLSEYHDLYELQRQRLERQIATLSDEKELWSGAAYNLSLKVAEEYSLKTAKHLTVTEKSWSKLAHHFSILLSDRDTQLLAEIQKHVESWRALLKSFHMELVSLEEGMKESINNMAEDVARWTEYFKYACFNSLGQMIKPPKRQKIMELQRDLKAIDNQLTKELERYVGDALLMVQDQTFDIRREVEAWTDKALLMFGRHRGTTGAIHPDQEALMQLIDRIETLMKQYQMRTTGENGVAAKMINLQSQVEMWEMRVSNLLAGSITLQDKDWLALFRTLEEWSQEIQHTKELVGCPLSLAQQAATPPPVSQDMVTIIEQVQKWAHTTNNSIDSEDARLVEQVNKFHSDMVQWNVQVLLRLAPNKETSSMEALEMALIGCLSVPELVEKAQQMFATLETFSNYVTLAGLTAYGYLVLPSWWEECNPEPLLKRLEWEVVRKKQIKEMMTICFTEFEMSCANATQEDKKILGVSEESLEIQLRDLRRLRSECGEWIMTAKQVMSQLTGQATDVMFPYKVPHDPQIITHMMISETKVGTPVHLYNPPDEDEQDTVTSEPKDLMSSESETTSTSSSESQSLETSARESAEASGEPPDRKKDSLDVEDESTADKKDGGKKRESVHFEEKDLKEDATMEKIEEGAEKDEEKTKAGQAKKRDSQADETAEKGEAEESKERKESQAEGVSERRESAGGEETPKRKKSAAEEAGGSKRERKRDSSGEEHERRRKSRSSSSSGERHRRKSRSGSSSEEEGRRKKKTHKDSQHAKKTAEPQVEMLFHDKNTHKVDLNDLFKENISRTPRRPDSRGYDPVATIQALQEALRATEQRAQEAEARASQALVQLARAEDLLFTQSQLPELAARMSISPEPRVSTSVPRKSSAGPSRKRSSGVSPHHLSSPDISPRRPSEKRREREVKIAAAAAAAKTKKK